MDVIMHINLPVSDEVKQAYKEYEKAKTKLIRALEAERLGAKEKAASAGTDTAK